MEEISEGIRHILSFLHVVQNSVDDYRQSLDQAFRKEYHAFVEDWKKANKPKKQIQNCEAKLDAKVQPEIEVSQPINIEELDHADQLLQKARKIRRQVPEKQNKSDVKLLSTKCNYNGPTKKLSSQTGQEGQTISPKLKSDNHRSAPPKCKMPTFLQKQTKATPGNQRNVCARGAAKPLRPFKDQASAHHKSTDRTVSCVTSPPSHLHTAVVSKETFLSLKNLCIADATPSVCIADATPSVCIADATPNLTAPEGNSKALSCFPVQNEKAGTSEVTISQKHLPTHREFYKAHNDRLHRQKRPFKLDQKWAWYAFLSSKDEVYVSRVVSCDSYEDLKKAHLLLTAMQESMFWFDLFNLIKKEICPHLQQLDKNERSRVQIIQCLKNICSVDL